MHNTINKYIRTYISIHCIIDTQYNTYIYDILDTLNPCIICLTKNSSWSRLEFYLFLLAEAASAIEAATPSGVVLMSMSGLFLSSACITLSASCRVTALSAGSFNVASCHHKHHFQYTHNIPKSQYI